MTLSGEVYQGPEDPGATVELPAFEVNAEVGRLATESCEALEAEEMKAVKLWRDWLGSPPFAGESNEPLRDRALKAIKKIIGSSASSWLLD